MSNQTLPAALPRWLIGVASAVIVFHLSSVVVRALTAPSGPWPTAQGVNYIPPPPFALTLYQWLPEKYLGALQMTHNYHFPSNRPGGPVVTLEFRLKDENGKVVETVMIPDSKANSWVRHRQSIMGNLWLSLDEPVTPPQMEAIPAPHRRAPSAQIWEMVPNSPNRMELKTVPEHLIPRDRPVVRPSEVSMLFARSYARYLCRSHGAARVELIRHHQDPIPPEILFIGDGVPAGAFEEVQSNFGELSK
jgi:hypothetical protein